MANIVLLDDNEIAQKAMKGILARTEHRVACFNGVDDAWDFIKRNIVIDLVILELKIKEKQGWVLLQQLREHGLLRSMPVVIYTKVADRNVVRRMLAMKVQNYLVKPYSDEKIFAEISKAERYSWRESYIEEEVSYCTQLNLTENELRARREKLIPEISNIIKPLRDAADLCNFDDLEERINDLKEDAEASGYWGLFDQLDHLTDAVEEERWPDAIECIDAIEFSEKLLYYLLNPGHIPIEMITEEEANAELIRKQKEIWLGRNSVQNCPIVSTKEITGKIQKLRGFPMVNAMFAKFQMALEGRNVSLSAVIDFAKQDPCLASQILVESAKLRKDSGDPVEDPKIAVQLLGESRLKGSAQNISPCMEDVFNNEKMTWITYWRFQIGVARICSFICEYMEIPNLMPTAYWAGLMHEVGKQIIAKMYPFALPAVIQYANSHHCRMMDAEKKFLDCTASEIGAFSAQKFGLPRIYCNVLRWYESPDKATEDIDMIAVVSLAHELCLRFEVGDNGEVPQLSKSKNLTDHPSWELLRTRVYPSLDSLQFEKAISAWIPTLKEELAGKMNTAVT